MKKFICTFWLLAFAQVPLLAQATTLELSSEVLDNRNMEFLSHQGAKPFQTALAMNIRYEPVKAFKKKLDHRIGKNLSIFKGWNPLGEAHITVITPPEYVQILKPYISIEQIEKIALNAKIQDTEIEILGLGRGQANIASKAEETYFLIIAAPNLVQIRKEIYKAFVKNHGPSEAWDPLHFYPHITIGFTKRDLHESDGVIKNLERSEDPRFVVKVVNL